ncbi:MAG TPA: ABC transporter permease [Solirubrobacterales bacterium]|jgi:peptide/nickel transport system permease protein|nr:ABC transporter permease [Solirubrobacterales bacterium]
MSALPGTLGLGRRRGRIRAGISRSNLGFTLAVGFLAIVVLGAILAPLIAPYDPAAIDLAAPSAGFSSEHLLGTDALGRDTLSQLFWGARPALIGPVILVLAAAIVGSAFGISAAWKGGVYDAIVSRAIDVLFAFPSLIIALILIALTGPGLEAAILGLLPGYAAFIARVVRSVALRERNLPYIAACVAQGQGGFQICARHLVPNLFPVIVTQSVASLSYALLDLAALSFLGVGTQGSTPDWGAMLAEAQTNLVKGHAGELLVVGTVLVATVVSLNVISDRFVMRDEQRRAGR